MTERWRRGVFLAGAAVLAAFILWGLAGLPGFGRYPGPYGDIINRIAVAQTNATGVVSAVNFEYRGFDTVGEEFILFAAAAGVATVLRHLRGEDKISTRQEALDRVAPPPSDALRVAALAFTGPAIVLGWWLATHAQTSPSGGFQGGVLLTTAFVLGGFVAVGVTALFLGLPFLSNYLPLGAVAGAVSSSGTIALISFLVGIEVGAAFLLIIGELMDQALLVREGRS
jgi:multicomponent Na+:H+ antiporter subunit B